MNLPIRLPQDVLAGWCRRFFQRSFDMTPDGKIVGMIPATSFDQTQAGTLRAPQIHVVLNWTEELKRLVPAT